MSLVLLFSILTFLAQASSLQSSSSSTSATTPTADEMRKKKVSNAVHQVTSGKNHKDWNDERIQSFLKAIDLPLHSTSLPRKQLLLLIDSYEIEQQKANEKYQQETLPFVMEYRMKWQKRMAHLTESEKQEFLTLQKRSAEVEQESQSKYEATFLKIKLAKRNELELLLKK